jgi:hypothetical protein
MVDDPAVSTDMTLKLMVPLVGDKIACPACEKREVYLFFMTLADLDRHIRLHHVDARIQWGCINCQRCFTKLHGARCYLPKCNGTSLRRQGSYKCEACPTSFGTQRGLSIHERPAHPAIRNEKRKEAVPANSRNWQKKRLTSCRNSMKYIRTTDFLILKLVRSSIPKRQNNERVKGQNLK